MDTPNANTLIEKATVTENYLVWQPLLTGQSTQGRPITLWGSNNAQQLKTFVFSGIHGDEPESILLAKKLLNHYANHPKRSEMNLGVTPVLNPDGLLLNQRKNANAVDINRNFPTQNWEPNPVEEHYHSGPKPASEAETQFLMEVIEQFQPELIITIHTPYRLINYDGPALEFANQLAQYNGYPVEASIGYPTPGSFGTYAGIERDIPILTLELPEKEAFTQLELENNLNGLIAMIERL